MKTIVRNTVNDRPMKDGYYLDSYKSTGSGETVYQVCDDMGVIKASIFLDRVERFFADSDLPAPPANSIRTPR